jgi:hypothetical protein
MSSETAPLTDQLKPASPSAVGALLRACREKAGYDLGELSRQLRIRRAFLEAIETGRFADPARADVCRRLR